MRHVPLLIIVLILSLGGAYLGQMLARGKALRGLEVEAARIMQQILEAQEARREERQDDPVRGQAPYCFLSELIAEQRLGGPLEAAPDSTPERELIVAAGYVFVVRLIDQYGLRYTGPEDRSDEPSIGQRYEAWAWPLAEDSVRLVIYFASSSGWLIQGENLSQLTGLRASPPSENPLRDISEHPHGSNRWIQLYHVRQ